MPDFKKYFIIPNAQPEEVFAALTFQPTLELWTGSPADFELQEGAEFSLWDGNIVGRVMAFQQGKMLQQEWYFGETQTPSIVTLKFHGHPKGTSLEVTHTNIPEEAHKDIVDGWHQVFVKELVDFYRE